MKIEKQVGRWSVEAFTDGFPASVVVEDTLSDDNPCERVRLQMTPEELRDLIYCCQRVLGRIPERNREMLG